MRPSYCTEKDIKNQLEIVREACSLNGLTYEDFPGGKYAPLDYFLHKDKKRCALAEIKHRRLTFEPNGSFYIATKKIDKGLLLSSDYNAPLVLIIRFLNATCYTVVENTSGYKKIKLGRINNQRDEADREWMYVIPMTMFNPIDRLSQEMAKV